MRKRERASKNRIVPIQDQGSELWTDDCNPRTPKKNFGDRATKWVVGAASPLADTMPCSPGMSTVKVMLAGLTGGG